MSRGALALVGGLALFALGCAQSIRDVASAFAWSELPPLPDGVGLAGACVGVSGDVLIVAGGANLPHGPPWDGHPKVWHDRVLVLAFTREATGPGALVGAVASLGLLGWVATATELSGLLYAAIGIVSCMAIGWLASLALPRPARSIEGLTIHTLRR